MHYVGPFLDPDPTVVDGEEYDLYHVDPNELVQWESCDSENCGYPDGTVLDIMPLKIDMFFECLGYELFRDIYVALTVGDWRVPLGFDKTNTIMKNGHHRLIIAYLLNAPAVPIIDDPFMYNKHFCHTTAPIDTPAPYGPFLHYDDWIEHIRPLAP